jgi:phosphoesterase RecJ-like protein
MMQAIEAVADLIQHHQKFVLATHVNPDGDGLGSEVALAEWLAGQGKTVSILNHSATPIVYLFLDRHKRIRQFDRATDGKTVDEADIIAVMDANHPDRLGSMTQRVLESKAIKVCIDHHVDAAPFASHYLIDEDATSTGEIIYRLLLRLGGKAISPLIAQALYCAIMTDTGSFRYPRVDPEIHRIVADLIGCGADPVEIYHNVYEQWSAGRIKLLGETLAGLKTENNGQLAHVTVTRDILRRTGTTEVDTDNFTTYPMSVTGVVAGILFVELMDGIKISFRSKGDIPINELAKEFGGNGHKNAAGARVHGMTLDIVRDKVITAAAKYFQSH